MTRENQLLERIEEQKHYIKLLEQTLESRDSSIEKLKAENRKLADDISRLGTFAATIKNEMNDVDKPKLIDAYQKISNAAKQSNAWDYPDWDVEIATRSFKSMYDKYLKGGK